ncbi:MAG TPA: glycosyltransferase family 2 protein [Pseudolysinimonas sp.]|nr:glycosyltransferase family 2 protein [Pseudolysinimonas sp.]
MPPLDRTLIVMPAFNEAQSVGQVVEEVFTKLHGVNVLVVDDGSSDATSDVARRAGARVATLPFNLGVGGAVRVGFRFALENGYTTVVQIDADGQHDPSSVPVLLEQLDHADLVLGARFAGEGDYRVRGPRSWAMKCLAVVVSISSKTSLTDTTSGYRASGPRAIALFAEHYPAEYLGDTVESLVIAARAGLTIRQIPVSMRVRQAGTPSHNPVKAATYLVRAVVALVFAYVRPSSTYRVVG